MRENTGGGSPSPPPPTEERAGERRRSLKIPSPWPSPRAPLAGRGNGCLRGRTIFFTKHVQTRTPINRERPQISRGTNRPPTPLSKVERMGNGFNSRGG